MCLQLAPLNVILKLFILLPLFNICHLPPYSDWPHLRFCLSTDILCALQIFLYVCICMDVDSHRWSQTVTGSHSQSQAVTYTHMWQSHEVWCWCNWNVACYVLTRQLSRLYEAYTVDEFCQHILPVIIANLAKDQVAKVRQAAIEAVSFLSLPAPVFHHTLYIQLYSSKTTARKQEKTTTSDRQTDNYDDWANFARLKFWTVVWNPKSKTEFVRGQNLIFLPLFSQLFTLVMHFQWEFTTYWFSVPYWYTTVVNHPSFPETYCFSVCLTSKLGFCIN